MFTREYWKLLVERAIKTAAQAAIGALGGASVAEISGYNLNEWMFVGVTVLIATAMSVVTSLAGNFIATPGDPAWVQTPDAPIVIAPQDEDNYGIGGDY